MPKRVDMTPEQYEAVCERLRKARAVAEVKIKKQTQVPEPEPEPVKEPEPEPEAEPLPEYEPPEPAYELPPPPTVKPKKVSAPKPIKPKPEPVDLDSYFEAKYRAKSKYIPQPSYNHPYQDEVNRQMAQAPPEPSPAQLIRKTAREQIQGRVNNEMFNIAMRSVFPTV